MVIAVTQEYLAFSVVCLLNSLLVSRVSRRRRRRTQRCTHRRLLYV